MNILTKTHFVSLELFFGPLIDLAIASTRALSVLSLVESVRSYILAYPFFIFLKVLAKLACLRVVGFLDLAALSS